MRDIMVYLEDIEEAIALIKNSIKGKDKNYFHSNFLYFTKLRIILLSEKLRFNLKS